MARGLLLVALVAAAAVLAGCDEEPTLGERKLDEPAPEPEPSPKPERDPRCPASADDEVVLALHIEPGPSVSAVLCNGTGDAFHYTTRGSSPALEVQTVDGELLERENRLANRRRQVRIREQGFQEIGPGEAQEIGSLDVEPAEDDAGWQLDWYPYRFSGVKPGRYRARASWTSSRTDTTDGSSVDDVWTGSLETRWRPFTLPERSEADAERRASVRTARGARACPTAATTTRASP